MTTDPADNEENNAAAPKLQDKSIILIKQQMYWSTESTECALS